jgi:EAL domain-containing protein (putative c-di-GMP-specific phosphodiesterase class I)/GGDEF domain-containing protein
MIKTLNKYEAQLVVLGALIIAYVLAFVPLHNLLGDLVFLPAALLVAVVGWLWGLWAGVLAGVLTFPLLLLLLNLFGEAIGIRLFQSGLFVGTPVMVAIGAMVGRMREMHERIHKQVDQLEHQALHDPLTGLPNRLLFSDRLAQALARARRRKESIAMLFMDLDNFKVVAVLLEGVASLSDATEVAERIAEILRAPFPLLEGQEKVVTSSMGISLSTPEAPSGEDVQENMLLRNADTAMYQAKVNGKARYEVFDKSMHSQALERLKLESDLRRALEKGELRLYYQPKVRLKTGEVFAMEALVRWEHPEQGLILPSQIIPLAEETGLIFPLGQWVLRESCRQTRRWHDQFPDISPLGVCVNLSAKEFDHHDLVEDVARNLRETELDPSTLTVEITESILMEDVPRTVAVLEEVKSLGVKLGVDDFGTGYSALSYLKRFPIDCLKIDRSIIEGLGQDSTDEAVATAAIVLAHALGAQVTAEGIMTSEQLGRLRALGCDAGQGFYFCEPRLSEAAIAHVLETSENRPD